MVFTLPTTKAEMYQTLQTIYRNYRLNTSTFISRQRQTLTLSRLSFTPLTDAELSTKAENLIDGEFTREKKNAEDALNEQISALNVKKTNINTEYVELIASVNKKYDDLESELKSEACKKGLTYSSLLTEKLYDNEKDRADEVLKYQTENAEKISEINGEISALQTKLTALTTFYTSLKSKDILAKKLELKDEQDKLVREITKYNTTLTEKEIRYHNSMIAEDISFELQYLEIKSKGLTKEELTDNGYYSDVIRCMSGYYDTLSATVAYNDILEETGLMVYLEDYYQDFVYIYKSRALS